MRIELDQAALEQAFADKRFGNSACLTFYLVGDPDNHLSMRANLEEMGASNLDGAEWGFVYAEVPIALNKDCVLRRIDQGASFAGEGGILIDLIDIDSSPDVESSKFYTLWKG